MAEQQALQEQRVSVVVMTKNAEHLVRGCLEALRLNQPFELIVIDGVSSDSTVERARGVADQVISDEGKGFSYARQLGVETARGEYVAFVGVDNVVPEGWLQGLTAELQASGYAGIQSQMRVWLDQHSTYWDRCWNEYFRLTHPPGEQPVIGTPAIFVRRLLLEFGYDPGIGPTDDTDLCLRLRLQGYRVGVGTTLAYEKQRLTFRGFARRWRWYGMGDARFVLKYRKSPAVAVRHLLHPLRTYILGLSWKALREGKVTYVPFFVLCGLLRYVGLLQEMPRLLFRRSSGQAGAVQ